MKYMYTDGSYRDHVGGWSCVMINGEDICMIGGVVMDKNVTCNRCELLGVINGMRYINSNSEEWTIYSDSNYVVLGVTEWSKVWVKNNWKSASGKPVLNQDLWMELLEISKDFKGHLKYVKAHCNIYGNEFADRLSKYSCDIINQLPLNFIVK